MQTIRHEFYVKMATVKQKVKKKKASVIFSIVVLEVEILQLFSCPSKDDSCINMER